MNSAMKVEDGDFPVADAHNANTRSEFQGFNFEPIRESHNDDNFDF